MVPLPTVRGGRGGAKVHAPQPRQGYQARVSLPSCLPACLFSLFYLRAIAFSHCNLGIHNPPKKWDFFLLQFFSFWDERTFEHRYTVPFEMPSAGKTSVRTSPNLRGSERMRTTSSLFKRRHLATCRKHPGQFCAASSASGVSPAFPPVLLLLLLESNCCIFNNLCLG